MKSVMDFFLVRPLVDIPSDKSVHRLGSNTLLLSVLPGNGNDSMTNLMQKGSMAEEQEFDVHKSEQQCCGCCNQW